MRAIIIGSSGQLAAAFRAALATRGADVLSSSSHDTPGALPLNLGSRDSIRAFFRAADERQTGPREIFLAGALTHVDRCEKERELCHSINTEGPIWVAEECKTRGHKLTFFSTEYVFGNAEYEGGAVGPFSEEDSPSPTSYYGACKLEAERGIRDVLGDSGALIVRTTMVFSWAPKGNNFLMQYFGQLNAVAEGREPALFRVPEDQISTPTYAPYLANDTLRLRESGVGGIVNLVGSDLISRRELVEKVTEHFGFDHRKNGSGFQFLKTAELGQAARRPLTAGLRTEKAARLGIKARALAEAFSDIDRLRGK